MNPTEKQIADVLDGAADAIIEHGWTQHHAMDTEGRICLVGGVCVATGIPLTRGQIAPDWEAIEANPLANAAFETLKRLPFLTPTPTCWNDNRSRTEDDVHDTLRTTAKVKRDA